MVKIQVEALATDRAIEPLPAASFNFSCSAELRNFLNLKQLYPRDKNSVLCYCFCSFSMSRGLGHAGMMGEGTVALQLDLLF
jgi:hypothetical protein